MLLIDTSAWIDYFRPSGDPGVRQRVGLILEKNQAGWCEMIRLELQCSPRSSQSAAISTLESVAALISIDQDCWSYACELSQKSKKQGKPVPNTDILIYATACIHRVALVHNDKHFDWLDELTGKCIARR